MQEAPTVHKEFIFLSVLLLAIVLLGVFAFDLYMDKENNTITAAVVATEPEQKITGQVIGITGAATADEVPVVTNDKQIGVYTVLPSFSFTTQYNLAEEYNTLQEQIRLFYDDVLTCKKNTPLDDCVALELDTSEYSSWLDDCETNEEKIFYDFTEIFSQCLNSEENDCTCTGTLQGEYEPGEYSIAVLQDGENTAFQLEDLTLSLPFQFTIEDNEMKSDTYIIHVDNTGVLGSFSSTNPSSEVYIYKSDETTLSVEDETTFSTYETTRESCTPASQEVYKFCKQSSTAVQNKPIVYVFAVDFSE